MDGFPWEGSEENPKPLLIQEEVKYGCRSVNSSSLTMDKLRKQQGMEFHLRCAPLACAVYPLAALSPVLSSQQPWT